MARTKASQMNRKFKNVDDSSGSSSEESSGQDVDMVEGEKEEQGQQEMGAEETGTNSKKQKSKKGRGKGRKELPSHKELLARLARKREADRLGAQRRKQEKQEEWDGMVARLEDLQAQLRTAKCLTPAIDQYYSRHGLEGLETEQARLAVLKWVGREKTKTNVDMSQKSTVNKSRKGKGMGIKDKSNLATLQERRVLTPSQHSLLPPPSQQLPLLPLSHPSSKPQFRTSTPVRKSSLKSPLNTSPTSKLLASSSSKPFVAPTKSLPSTTTKSLLSSGEDSSQPSHSPPPPEVEETGLNTSSGSTAFSVDGSFTNF